MAEDVIDLSEAIKIKAKNREPLLQLGGLLKRAREMIGKGGAIGQVCQDVMPRKMGNPVFGAFTLSQVKRHGNRGVVALVDQRVRFNGHEDFATISGQMTSRATRIVRPAAGRDHVT